MTSAPPTLRFDRGTLLLSGVRPDGLGALGSLDWIWDERVSAFRLEALHYSRVKALLGVAGVVDEVPPPVKVGWPESALPRLRPEQEAALAALRAAGGRGVVVMPTGTGKTEVGLAAMQESSVATLVVAPVRDLMYQWHRRIRRGLGYDAGILGDSLRIYAWADILQVPRDAFFRFVTGEAEKMETRPAERAAARLTSAEAELVAAYRRLPAKYQRRLLDTSQDLQTLARSESRRRS